MRQYLKDLRKEAGFSQTDVAKMLGMTQANMAMIESGRNKVLSTELAMALAEIYKCDVKRIIDGELKYGTDKR